MREETHWRKKNKEEDSSLFIDKEGEISSEDKRSFLFTFLLALNSIRIERMCIIETVKRYSICAFVSR